MNPVLEQARREHDTALGGFFEQAGDEIAAVASVAAHVLRGGGKLLFCGNGGSACDAMHIAGEFVGRFIEDRPGLPAIALSADAGILTAVANDYAYDYVFARQVEALGRPGDMLVALSTSGSSPNVVKAIAAAHGKGMVTVLFTGEKGRENKAQAAHLLVVPSRVTAHVQEAHMVALHAMTGMIEKQAFSAQ